MARAVRLCPPFSGAFARNFDEIEVYGPGGNSFVCPARCDIDATGLELIGTGEALDTDAPAPDLGSGTVPTNLATGELAISPGRDPQNAIDGSYTGGTWLAFGPDETGYSHLSVAFGNNGPHTVGGFAITRDPTGAAGNHDGPIVFEYSTSILVTGGTAADLAAVTWQCGGRA